MLPKLPLKYFDKIEDTSPFNEGFIKKKQWKK